MLVVERSLCVVLGPNPILRYGSGSGALVRSGRLSPLTSKRKKIGLGCCSVSKCFVKNDFKYPAKYKARGRSTFLVQGARATDCGTFSFLGVEADLTDRASQQAASWNLVAHLPGLTSLWFKTFQNPN